MGPKKALHSGHDAIRAAYTRQAYGLSTKAGPRRKEYIHEQIQSVRFRCVRSRCRPDGGLGRLSVRIGLSLRRLPLRPVNLG